MKVTSETQRTIYLTMAEDEAMWLLTYLQNSSYKNESGSDLAMRQKFFESLKECITT